MKILHTGDWHLNDALGRVDRTQDLFRSVEQISKYLHERQVDVLLIAGDLFSERSRPDSTRAAIERLKKIFTPFLQRGGTIVAISGNHDSEVLFSTLRDAIDLVAPGKAEENGQDDTDATGRLWLAPNPRLLKLRGPQGEVVQFLLAPYPTARAYLRGEKNSFSSIEEKNRVISGNFLSFLRQAQDKLIDPKLPAVLVSHIHVRGAQTHTLYRVTEVEDVVFEPEAIPTGWAYAAFGHIHKAQAPLAGSEHVRYCGSIERMDFAEAQDQKSVVLFEVGPHGRVGEIEILPLDCPAIHRVVITDARTELAQLKTLYPDHATALVQYELHWLPGRDNRDDIARAVNEIFPRWYAREFRQIDRVESKTLARVGVDLNDVAGNVRRYLNEQLVGNVSREDILALAEEYLAARGESEKPPEAAQVLAAPGGEAAEREVVAAREVVSVD